MLPKIIKSAGVEYVGGPACGHCYDGPGWEECTFWVHDGKSLCMLFGLGVEKDASKSLKICDKIYGVNYNGEV